METESMPLVESEDRDV